MKLKLRNFRCHADKELKCDDVGLLQLSGKNGYGKTTLLEAIYFALYGDVKRPYPLNSGDKISCSVDLEYQGLIIKRSCRPNRLLVQYDNTQYEDDEAQGLINKIIMNKYEFLASSYIKQKTNASVISMTPTEQLEFIKNIAFNSEMNVKVKNLIKDMIKDTNDDLIKAKKMLEMTQSQLFDMQEECDTFEVKINPIRTTEEQFNSKYSALQTDIEKHTADAAVLKKKIDTLSIKLKEQRALELKQQRLQFEYETLEGEFNELNQIKLDTSEEIATMQTTIELLIKKREDIVMYNKYIEDEQQFEEDQQKYFDGVQSQITELENNILNQETEEFLNKKMKVLVIYEDMKKKVNVLIEDIKKKFPNDQQNITFDRLKDILKMLRLKNPVKIYTCPSCNTNLALKNDNLVMTTAKKLPTHATHSALIEKWISVIEAFFEKSATVDECVSENVSHNISLDEAEEFINNNNINKKELAKLKQIITNKTLPQYLEKMYVSMDKIKQFVDEFDDCDTDIDTITQNITRYKEHIDKQIQTKKRVTELTNLMNVKYNVIQNINAQLTLDDKNMEALQADYKKINDALSRSLVMMNNNDKLKLALSKYNAFIKHTEKINLYKTKLEQATKQYDELEIKYKSLIVIREKSHQAEIFALDSVVNSINEHAKTYLEQLFQEDTIDVRIQLFKQTKSDLKMKMNTYINYKSAEYESIDQLSGGERQKCELAFELAVNNYMNSKLLLLDECINNLDADMNQEALHILHQYAHEAKKLIIVITQEAVEGLFDNTISVKKAT